MRNETRYFAWVLITLNLVIIPTIASAQDWTFDEIRQQAIDTHPSILVKQSSSLAAKADIDTALWQRYPTLAFEASKDSSNAATTNILSVQQPLWSGGRITAGINAAQFKFDAAEAAIEESKQDITLKVIAAYTEALRQQQRQEYAIKSVKSHEELLRLISRRTEYEVSPLVDKDFAQSRLYQVMNDLSAINQSLTAAYTLLSQLINDSVNKVGELDADPHGVPVDKDSTLQQAIEHSPTLRRLSDEAAAAGADVESKKSAYWPQLAMRYENINGQTNGKSNNNNRALLVLGAQSGAGLSAKSSIEAAAARQQAAQQARDTALRDLREKVSLDWSELIASRIRQKNAELTRAMTTEVFNSYTRQYTAGRKTWIDVLNAIREASQSELALADSNAQIMGATLRLQLLTGNLPTVRGVK